MTSVLVIANTFFLLPYKLTLIHTIRYGWVLTLVWLTLPICAVYAQSSQEKDLITKIKRTDVVPETRVSLENTADIVSDSIITNQRQHRLNSVNRTTDRLPHAAEKVLTAPQRTEQQLRQQVADQKSIKEAQQINNKIQQETNLAQQAGIGTPMVPKISSSLPTTKLSETSLRIPDAKLNELQQVSQEGISAVKMPEQLGTLKQSLSSHQSDIAALKKGKIHEADGLSDVASQQVMRTEEGTLLQRQQQKIEAMQQQPGTYQQKAESYQDQHYLKNQARQKLMEASKDHLAEQPEALRTGQQQMSKLKRRYSEVQSEQDKYVRASRLPDSSWVTRLVPGILLQVRRGSTPLLPTRTFDLMPFVGYRFNTRWSVGLGGIYC